MYDELKKLPTSKHIKYKPKKLSKQEPPSILCSTSGCIRYYHGLCLIFRYSYTVDKVCSLFTDDNKKVPWYCPHCIARKNKFFPFTLTSYSDYDEFFENVVKKWDEEE